MPEPVLAAAVEWGAAASLLVTSLAIMGSPGPATISLTAVGSAYGVRRSLAYLLGIVLGTGAVLLAVAAGVTAALLAAPALRVALLAVSAGYILRLAYRVATAPPLAVQAEAAAAPSFGGGAMLGVANPKAWVAIAAVFASAHLARSALTDAAAKTALLAGMIVAINGTWLLAGAALAPALRDPRRARIVNALLAVSLVAATGLAVVR